MALSLQRLDTAIRLMETNPQMGSEMIDHLCASLQIDPDSEDAIERLNALLQRDLLSFAADVTNAAFRALESPEGRDHLRAEQIQETLQMWKEIRANRIKLEERVSVLEKKAAHLQCMTDLLETLLAREEEVDKSPSSTKFEAKQMKQLRVRCHTF